MVCLFAIMQSKLYINTTWISIFVCLIFASKYVCKLRMKGMSINQCWHIHGLQVYATTHRMWDLTIPGLLLIVACQPVRQFLPDQCSCIKTITTPNSLEMGKSHHWVCLTTIHYKFKAMQQTIFYINNGACKANVLWLMHGLDSVFRMNCLRGMFIYHATSIVLRIVCKKSSPANSQGSFLSLVT